MKIIIGDTAGFCMGVKRAVDLALEHAGKSSAGVYTLGPLIHNNQTIEMLKERHVVTLDESKPTPADATILIRAHGVPPDIQNAWIPKGRIVDGTCPKVKTVHRVIEKYRSMGYSIIITGDEGHAEVIGLQGYAGNLGYLICTTEDVDKLPDFDKICLVSQTTFDNTIFDDIANRIRQRYHDKDIIIKKTICSATDTRQNETRELAKKVNAMIVVGGKNSANTKRLGKIAEECGTPTQLIETEDEIDWPKIAHCKTVGITAGASTPNWMIKRVVDFLQFKDQTEIKTPTRTILYLANLFSTLNIIVALGASSVYYASCILQGYTPTIAGAIISFLYFLSMYLWNGLTNIETTQHLGIGRYRFYRDHKSRLYLLVALCLLALLAASLSQSKVLFYIISFATVVGCGYHISIVPRPLKFLLRFTKLKDLPVSRDLFVALAWGIVLTVVPHANAHTPEISAASVFCFMIIFVLAFLRSLIFDLRDIEGDRIMGRETLVTIIGEAMAQKVILAATLFVCFVCGLSPFFGAKVPLPLHNFRFIFQIIPFFYLYVFVRSNRDHHVSRSMYFNILADAQFFIAGICAYLASVILL